LSVALEYGVENEELVVFDDGRLHYRGRTDGYPVEEVVPIPDGRDAIVLLRYSADGAPTHFANLVRVRPNGEIQWRAAPPNREPGVQDAWVACEWPMNGALTANSWSCFYCTIDPETGAIISSVFTK
jgi:hypothetical protein